MGLVFASHRDQRLRGGIILHLTHLKTYQKENSQKFFEKLNFFLLCKIHDRDISLAISVLTWPQPIL